MYALIEFAGKQFRVEEGDSIKVPYIDDKVGSKVTIDKILYLDDGKNKTVGNPVVKDVKIAGEIESHGRGRKVIVFKFKRRKGYQKKNTHREEYSILKVGKVGTAKKVAKKESTKPVKTKSSSKKEAVAEKKTTSNKAVANKTTAKKKKPAVKKTSSAQPKETKE